MISDLVNEGKRSDKEKCILWRQWNIIIGFVHEYIYSATLFFDVIKFLINLFPLLWKITINDDIRYHHCMKLLQQLLFDLQSLMCHNIGNYDS